jgi:hypothetical protein
MQGFRHLPPHVWKVVLHTPSSLHRNLLLGSSKTRFWLTHVPLHVEVRGRQESVPEQYLHIKMVGERYIVSYNYCFGICRYKLKQHAAIGRGIINRFPSVWWWTWMCISSNLLHNEAKRTLFQNLNIYNTEQSFLKI